MTENRVLSDLSLSLCVYSAKLSVHGINYIDLGDRLFPMDHVLAINSNFVHKAQKGFEQYISKPKKDSPRIRNLKSTHCFRERKKIGDGTCFNACLLFIIRSVSTNPLKMYFFPTSGDIQVFGVVDDCYHSAKVVVERFISYLKVSSPCEFSQVDVVNTNLSLLNYRFHVNLSKGMRLDISKLFEVVTTDIPPPFDVVFVNDSIGDIRKLSIRLNISGKNNRIHIWPSGKINVMGVPSIDDAFTIYDYFNSIFASDKGDIIIAKPIPDYLRKKK